MSLDVYLFGEERDAECVCNCGHKHSHKEKEEHYSANITHNLGKMAMAAGIYEHLWRPEEIGITNAAQLIAPLTEGLEKLKASPTAFRKFDATNGWGKYEHLVDFVEGYLAACREYPNAFVQASR